MEIERRNKANRNKIWMHTINTKGATTTTTITNSLLLFLNRAFVTCLCYCFFFVSPVHSLCTGMNVLALKWLHSAVVRRLSLYFFFLFSCYSLSLRPFTKRYNALKMLFCMMWLCVFSVCSFPLCASSSIFDGWCFVSIFFFLLFYSFFRSSCNKFSDFFSFLNLLRHSLTNWMGWSFFRFY